MIRVLTAGETMALFDPAGSLEYGTTFTLRMGGAESNVAIALSRLGIGVRWISRLGEDELGDMVLATLEAEGVDTSYVQRDHSRPTALFLKIRREGSSEPRYYRTGSAASELAVGDAPPEALAGIELVHLTGITMALSPSARTFCVDLARWAHEAGIKVVFDPNFRGDLWARPKDAAAAFAEVLPLADWVLCGESEAKLLGYGADPEAAATALRAAGATGAVVRSGRDGALLAVDGRRTLSPPPRLVDVVDEIGAGDAFAAGFIFGLLDGRDPEAALGCAHGLAAAALQGTGDWETLPHKIDAPFA